MGVGITGSRFSTRMTRWRMTMSIQGRSPSRCIRTRRPIRGKTSVGSRFWRRTGTCRLRTWIWTRSEGCPSAVADGPCAGTLGSNPVGPLQVVCEEFGYAFPEQTLGRRIADTVAAARKGHNLDILPVANQIVDQRKSVRVMNVVVARAVGDKQLSPEIARVLDR